MKQGNTNDLTSGPIGRQLLLFALPLLGISLIQQLYNMVDLLFVGNLLGKEATAAVGASSLLITCIVGFFTGLSVGTGVVIAMAVGQQNEAKIQRVIHTAMGLSLAGGAVLTVLGVAAARQLLVWMNTPAEVMESAVVYIRIYLLSMIPLFIYNMNSGILRAGGNSRAPMFFQLAGGLANVLFDWILIQFAGLGVAGAAWATFGSQLAASLCSVVYLMRQEGAWHFDWRKIRIDVRLLGEILRIGVPAGLQSMVMTLSNIFIQYAINRLGVDAVSAFAVYGKVELIVYLPLVAFGQSMTTFSGQNVGAGKLDRVRKGVRVCMGMGIVSAVVTAALLLIFGKFVFGLFVPDAAVIACGLRLIHVTFPFYWMFAILETFADAIRGAGKSIPPMLTFICNICVLRTVLLALFMHLFGTLEAVAAVYPSVWLTASLTFFVYWKSGRWKPEGVLPEKA